MAALLPPGFEILEPFVESWAMPDAPSRARRRLESEDAERAAFYSAAKDLVVPALARLDQKPLHQFDEQETRLMRLLLTLCHISLAVEMQGDQEAKQAKGRRHMRITRAPADT